MPLTPEICGRIGKLIRLLGSDKDGEVIAAVAALRRTLDAAGTDLHGLAAMIERQHSQPRLDPHSDDREPDTLPWKVMASICRKRLDAIPARHHQFILQMSRRRTPPTPRQFDYLLDLYEQVCEAA
jgi:hypothetical protein